MRVEFKRNLGLNFFFSFSANLIPFWLEIIAKRGFLIFLIFLLFFSEFSCPGRIWTEFGSNFFFAFSAYLIPFWLKIMLESRFLFFFYFFVNILARGEYERNSGLKCFSRFLGHSHPVLAKNNIGKRVLNFLNFLSIFFIIFLCGSRLNGIRD